MESILGAGGMGVAPTYPSTPWYDPAYEEARAAKYDKCAKDLKAAAFDAYVGSIAKAAVAGAGAMMGPDCQPGPWLAPSVRPCDVPGGACPFPPIGPNIPMLTPDMPNLGMAVPPTLPDFKLVPPGDLKWPPR